MKIQMLLVSFVVISALFIISNNNLHVQNPAERVAFGNSYYIWLGAVFDNFKVITGDVLSAKWLPETNSAQSTNTANDSVGLTAPNDSSQNSSDAG